MTIIKRRVRTGKELILATRPFARDFTARSWWHVLSTAFLLAAAVAGTLWNFNLGGRIICSIFAGLLMLRFFVIYHDQQHQAILPHSRLAEGLMRVFGILVLSPTSIWQSSHNHHHNHNSKLQGFSHRFFSDHDQRPVLEILEGRAFQVSIHASSSDHPFWISGRISLRNVYRSVYQEPPGTL